MCAPARAQARARFVVQVREPLSRHVSFLQMESRIGKSRLLVQTSTQLQLRVWEAFIANRYIPSLFP